MSLQLHTHTRSRSVYFRQKWSAWYEVIHGLYKNINYLNCFFHFDFRFFPWNFTLRMTQRLPWVFYLESLPWESTLRSGVFIPWQYINLRVHLPILCWWKNPLGWTCIVFVSVSVWFASLFVASRGCITAGCYGANACQYHFSHFIFT